MKKHRLDRRVTIERFKEAPNAFNELVKAWTPITTVWTSKEDIRDSERFAAAQLSASITTRFQIRHSPRVADLSVTDRLQFEGRVYEIAAVKEIGRNDRLEITASARVDG